MNIDFMRWVDRRIGTPICFALFVIRKLKGVIGLERIDKNHKPKKILFVELSEMGSTILAYSAIIKSKKIFPGSQAYFLIFDDISASVDLLDIIPKKNTLTIRRNSIFSLALDTLKFLVKVRRERIDVVIDMELFSRFTAILSYLSGAKYRVGFYRFHMEGLYRGNLQTHNVAYNPYQHMSKNIMSLLYSLQEDIKEVPHLKRTIHEKEIKVKKVISDTKSRNRIFNKLKAINPKISETNKIVLINPNASVLLPMRKWPLKNYIELAKRILADKNVFLVITGVKSDLPDAVAMCKALDYERCINLAAKTSLRELIDLYNIASLLITNDSGPSHFSSLTDIRTIVFYGPETPLLYGPLGNHSVVMYSDFSCSPCVSAYNHRKTACKDNKCLKVITVDEVYSVVQRLL